MPTTASTATNTYYKASLSVLAITLIVIGVISVLSIGCCIGGWIWIKRRRSRQAAAAAQQQKAFLMNQTQAAYPQPTGGTYVAVPQQGAAPGMYYPQQYNGGYPAQPAYGQGGI
ncbi:hypothetical protein CVT24_001798 [Panaeolus cyanescens]|uniref:Uncharacterized protein n=1 Tax=Panaeolus cyanescens TaxID=181874 RepID=A0A409YFP9_9AGAR|nr:hypothetical protein CVT24_001798 [Panaeolus cyanescens]